MQGKDVLHRLDSKNDWWNCSPGSLSRCSSPTTPRTNCRTCWLSTASSRRWTTPTWSSCWGPAPTSQVRSVSLDWEIWNIFWKCFVVIATILLHFEENLIFLSFLVIFCSQLLHLQMAWPRIPFDDKKATSTTTILSFQTRFTTLQKCSFKAKEN